jgi:hypothetical protein
VIEVIPGVVIIESDIPEGMTLREWRRTHIPPRGRPMLVRLARRLCGVDPTGTTDRAPLG